MKKFLIYMLFLLCFNNVNCMVVDQYEDQGIRRFNRNMTSQIDDLYGEDNPGDLTACLRTMLETIGGIAENPTLLSENKIHLLSEIRDNFKCDFLWLSRVIRDVILDVSGTVYTIHIYTTLQPIQ